MALLIQLLILFNDRWWNIYIQIFADIDQLYLFNSNLYSNFLISEENISIINKFKFKKIIFMESFVKKNHLYRLVTNFKIQYSDNK